MGENNNKRKSPHAGNKGRDAAGPQKKNFNKKRDAKGSFKKDNKNQKMFGKKGKNDKGQGGDFQVVKEEIHQKIQKKNFHAADKDDQPQLNRRQKQKVSDLIKKLRINYNKLLIKKKEEKIPKEEKTAIIDECIELIGTKFEELCFKHDGCRVLQALLKYGNKKQRSTVIENIKEHYLHLMTNKYSHYLASKAYLFAPEPEQKQYFRTLVTKEINKYIIHAYASEVIEYIYNLSTDQEKREMVFSFYGNYFLLLKEIEDEKTMKGKQITLKTFIEKKPQLADQILHRLEKVAVKLVEKGLTRHTIVQAILYDYYQNCGDIERIKNINDLIKEKLPALLASKQGLYVACACFKMLDVKDRKAVVKTFKEIIKELFTNKIGHLFIIHVLNTVDDTTLSKKKVIAELLKSLDELIDDKCYQAIFIGIFYPKSKTYFHPEDIESFEAFDDYSTSKKSEATRRQELLKMILKPLETFLEEHLIQYLLDINKNPILKMVLKGIIEFGYSEDHQDLFDELHRQLFKVTTYGEEKGILLGHPDIHRVMKELVKQEAEQEKTKEKLGLCRAIGGLMVKNLDEVIKTRAVFVLLELIEHENTKDIVIDKVQAKKKDLAKVLKEKPSAKGLQILLSKL